KPLGFLKVIDLFKKNGFEIFYFDFLDRNHEFYKNIKVKKGKYGCGNYFYKEVEKPQIYKNVPRKYKRFGLPTNIFLDFLKNIGDLDFIFITTGMTYWVLGVREVINIIKQLYPKVPIIVGGIYTSFCYEDAQNLKANYIFKGKDILKFSYEFSSIFNIDIKMPERIEPFWNVYKKLDYLVIKTSSGCPFSCWYCGIKQIEGVYKKRDVEEVVEEIIKNVEKFKIEDIAFYDDALFFNFEEHLYRILEKITKNTKNLRFHTPNGIHPKFIKKEVSFILKETNFKTIRLSLETINDKRNKESDNKVNFNEFEMCVRNLVDAGFRKEEIGVYILAGLPNQKPEEVIKTINILKNYPLKIKIAEYSPIPGTVDFEIAKNLYPELPISDPLFQNNSIYPLWNFKNKWEIINQIKQMIKS
ncbi:MAG: radical SAM protein, partial [bacterium]|nr:radical SAM protein [bacterium]MDW8164635.1 B12-binding domain-containing radical SAM protein [Candidatus Omnitrophota bacterium]